MAALSTPNVWFQSPDEDSFAPKAGDVHVDVPEAVIEFQSPDEDSFAPKACSADRGRVRPPIVSVP